MGRTRMTLEKTKRTRAKLYVCEFVRMFPGHVGRWECRTRLAPGFTAYGATESQARRRAAAFVKEHCR